MSDNNFDDDDDEPEEGPQVRVSLKLASSGADTSLKVPSAPIAVPSDIGRKGLSAVVNHLLGRSLVEDDENDSSSTNNNHLPPLSFEFILAGTNNKLLRKGVEKEARQHGVSLEEAITITYFPASNVPDLSGEEEAVPDWVSCLASSACRKQTTVIFSGCYDGTVHVYRKRRRNVGPEEKENVDISNLIKVNSATVATGPIKAMAATTTSKNQVLLATASMDHTLVLHTFDDETDVLNTSVECMASDTDTIHAISTLDFSSASDTSLPLKLASGDSNGTISIWNVDDPLDEIIVREKKNQKSSTGKKATSKELHPIVCMEGAHSQLISGVSWGNHRLSKSSCTSSSNSNNHLITGSWDHSIKLWDVEKQNCLLTLNGSRVVGCLDTSYHSEGVVATGHPDCTIRLWDVRINNTNTKPSAVITDHTFRPSHKGWVSDVKWRPSNAYHLASTSHDGTVKLWDIRSSFPLHTVRAFGKEEKGMCLLWEPSIREMEEVAKSSVQQDIIYTGGTESVIKQLIV
jgi:ribosome biogenesis protein